MKATGIVRRIDNLGRVVLPKEIRRTLRIREGDPLEIFTAREGEIILKKYSPVGELSEFAKGYSETLSFTSGYPACICDKDQIITAAGSGKKELQGKGLHEKLEEVLEARTAVLLGEGQEKKAVPLTKEDSRTYAQEAICPIVCEGDVIGGIIIVSDEKDSLFGETELKLATAAAHFIGKQLEQ